MDRWRVALATLCVLLTTAAWVGMGEGLQHMQDRGGRQYNKPYFINYLNTSAWTLLLLPWALWRWHGWSGRHDSASVAAMNKRSWRMFKIGAALSPFITISGYAWYYSLSHTSVSANTAIYTSECIFVFIFAVLLKERFHLPKFMSVMVTAGGVVVVTLFARGKEESGVEQNVFGYMAVTASVTTFALFEVLYERFAGEDDAAAAEGAQSKGAASPAAYTKAGAEGEGGEQNVWNGDLEVGGGEDDAVQHNQPVVHGALARTPEKLLSELAGETDGSDALRQALLGEVDIPEESEVITLPSHLSTARPVQLSPESRSVGSSPIFSRPVVAKGKVLAPPSPLSLGQSLAYSHKSSRRMERKASDASADDELQDTAEKMEKESGEESSILEDVMESLLFIGAIGAATVLLQWIPVPILHFTGVEPFEWPSHVLDLLFLNMGLDAFNNIGVIVAISLSSALYVSVLSVLTAPLSIAADIVLHHYSMPPLSFVGNALVLLGFFAYSVIEFRQESDESEPHRHIGSRVVARSAPRKQRRRNRAYSV